MVSAQPAWAVVRDLVDPESRRAEHCAAQAARSEAVRKGHDLPALPFDRQRDLAPGHDLESEHIGARLEPWAVGAKIDETVEMQGFLAVAEVDVGAND